MDTTILLAFIAMFGMGLNAIGNKMAAANGVYAPPFLLIVNIMYCVAALVLHSTQKQPFEISTRMIWLGLFVGLFGSISYICMFTAFKLGGEGSVLFPIRGLSVVVAVVFSFILFREPITWNRVLGLILGSSAIFLLSR
jgi:uncharacterized membrane protein|tara:strand:- start:1015 stop:1431 length:417 start_codon:yes stop_codon:yes gene_type:complete